MDATFHPPLSAGRPACFRAIRGWLAAAAWLGFSAPATHGQNPATNVSVVGVTPSGFSVVWALPSPVSPSMTPSISVFSDPTGRTNLTGQIGVEFYPLDAGDPTLTNSYVRRLNSSLLRQQTMAQGLVYVRVSECAPATTYYYRLQLSNPGGPPIVQPPALPLPGVATALENAFVLQSQELLIHLAGLNQNGSIVTLSNANAFAGLAALVSDGAGTNQAFFSVNDLTAAIGHANFPPVGSQDFTAAEEGLLGNNVSQTYALDFSTTFSVGQIDQFSLGSLVALDLGSTALRAGSAGGVSIGISASGDLTNLSFTLTVPTNRIASLALQSVSPQLGVTGVQPVAPGTFLVSMAAASGQTLFGTQTVARLNFSTVSNQSSAFVFLSPQSPQGANGDGSSALVAPGQSGRVAIVGAQPLLDAALDSGGDRILSLFGIPQSTYQIDYSTNLSRSNGWTSLLSVPMTNLVQVLGGLSTNQPAIFYRAHAP